MTPPPDIRKGKPSASYMGRLFECPGSFRLYQGLRKATGPAPASKEAESGRLIHRWLENQEPEVLDRMTPDERSKATQCVGLAEEAMALSKIGPIVAYNKEVRMWSKCERYSGAADLIVTDATSGTKVDALILDYKTGRLEPPVAEKNHQLRTLAVLAYQNYGYKSVVAGIAQPMASTPLTLCEYTEDDLKQAEMELSALMDVVEKPNAPLRAGPWCDFCPAKSICPLAAKEMIAKTVIGGAVADLSPAELSEIAMLAKAGKAVFEAVEDRIKEMLSKDKDSVPGWKLSEPVKVRSLPDAQKVWCAMSDYMGSDTFATCCKTSFTALLPAFTEAAKANGEVTNDNDAKRLLYKTLESITEYNERAPQLERIDPC